MESLQCTERTRILQIVFIQVVCAMSMATQICPYNTSFEYEVFPQLQLPASVSKVDVATLTKTCKCVYDTLTCSSLDNLAPLYTGADALNITSFNLWNGNITSISRNSLPPGLNSIYFYDHPMTNISDDAFYSSAQTLNSLTIIGARFRQLPKALLVLTNLTSLQIQQTPKQDWDDSILQHIIANVTHLILKNVGLNKWPASISSCHTLVNLDLSDNPLKTIPQQAFLSFAYTLKELDLGHTALTQIPIALSSLQNLTTLDLGGLALNNAHDVEKLASMPFGDHLMFLNLESSQLKTILNFSSFTNLTAVMLNNNSISDATSGSFPFSLSDLFLANNHLSSVPTSVADLPHLASLYLSHNQITSIEPDSLPPSLTRLDLTYNKIKVITNTSFVNMTNLSYLQLSSNPISTIDPSAFLDLVSLKNLGLGDIPLTEIPLFMATLPRDIDLYMIIYDRIPCPCPPPQELVDWMKLSNETVNFSVDCDSYISIELYLTTGCDSTSTVATVATPGGASTLQCCLFSLGSSVLLLTTVFWVFLY
ncbi:unnamed protein product [Candidula unifasciata]|uniref:Uncharacterized protein n=1 Tax=Candidula unifasciata TaxID=100452 RepID=A0A8S3Z364_9EUPU|nr:unnamed protein product [Candidula unifasciata]